MENEILALKKLLAEKEEAFKMSKQPDSTGISKERRDDIKNAIAVIPDLKDDDIVTWLCIVQRTIDNFGLPNLLKETEAGDFRISNMIIEKRVTDGPALAIVQRNQVRSSSKSLFTELKNYSNLPSVKQAYFRKFTEMSQDESMTPDLYVYSDKVKRVATMAGIFEDAIITMKIRQSASLEWKNRFDIESEQITS